MIGCAPPDGGGDGPTPPDGTIPPDGPGTGETETDPDAFSLVSPIDPHAIALLALLDADDVDVANWVGETLLPEEYAGAMRAASGVFTGLMGNDIDRCLAARHLLSAGGIESRYVISGETCTVEAMIDGEVARVATSPYDTDPIPDNAERMTDIPETMQHRVEFSEAVYPGGGVDPVESILGSGVLADINSQSITGDYIEDETGVRFRLRIGDDTTPDLITLLGQPLAGAERHDLIIRQLHPNGSIIEHRRILFERDAIAGNQSPDVQEDLYAIWIGVHATGAAYHRFEREALAAPDSLASLLRLRAIELAVEVDHAAWRLFEQNDEPGAVYFDEMRVIIAGQEQRDPESDSQTPSLDLLANRRLILGSDDPVAMGVALGMSDAMVEGEVLARATGLHALSVPNIFAALFQEEANDEISRLELYDDALSRLELEGVTGEALEFHDATSGGSVRVVLVGGDLVLERTSEESAALESLAGDAFDELTAATDGLVLGDDAERGWPIDLLLLDQGAALEYTPTLKHIGSPQLGLATPPGTAVFGTGDYQGALLDFHAVARLFESLEDAGDPGSRKDQADWHVAGEAGAIAGNGSLDFDTPGLDESNPRLLQWGADRDNYSFYENPLWVAPAIAASIRAGDSFTTRMIYQEAGSSSSSHSIFFNKFSEGRTSIVIDGEVHGVATITARDQLGDRRITIARDGLTRLVLAMQTPAGQATITEIHTPQQLRLRGRIMSYRGSQAVRDAGSYAVGVADARVSIGGVIGTSWPDGSVDIRVPETKNPTLPASVAVLTDTSGSMGEPADPECTGEECAIKIDVVAESLATIVNLTD